MKSIGSLEVTPTVAEQQPGTWLVVLAHDTQNDKYRLIDGRSATACIFSVFRRASYLVRS